MNVYSLVLETSDKIVAGIFKRANVVGEPSNPLTATRNSIDFANLPGWAARFMRSMEWPDCGVNRS